MFGTPLFVPLHPTQLYEAAAEALIAFALWRRSLVPHKPGVVIGLYLAMYSSARFVVEFFRAHDAANPFGGPLSASQWIALALAALGVWILRRRPI
jgi:phosphatidylglycerol:prolipoprotein diacylglycerol transferase